MGDVDSPSSPEQLNLPRQTSGALIGRGHVGQPGRKAGLKAASDRPRRRRDRRRRRQDGQQRGRRRQRDRRQAARRHGRDPVLPRRTTSTPSRSRWASGPSSSTARARSSRRAAADCRSSCRRAQAAGSAGCARSPATIAGVTRVKICGVSDPADARRVADLGAWALGMIFWPQSPRACALEAARGDRRRAAAAARAGRRVRQRHARRGGLTRPTAAT